MPSAVRVKAGWGILLLALILRGLIPAGYMPQQAGVAQATAGLLPLAVCHGSVDVSTTDMAQWLADAQETDQSPESDPSAHSQAPCLFAVCLGHSALPAVPPMHWAALRWVPDWVATQPAVAALQAHFFPLGARAPPLV